MKDLLVLALLLAVPVAGQAGDPVDPAAAATTERPAAKEKAARPGAGERGATDAKGRPGAPREKEPAPAKAGEPCEPVKPCPID
jgi:hypothetical protein